MWPPLCLPTLRKINWGMSSLIVIINPIDQKPPADEGKHVTSSTIIRLSFSFVCTFVVVCSSFVRHSFVQPSPAMADCYVPPHPRFVRCLFLFVYRLFVVCSSFVHHSFIICSPFVRCSFVRCSFVVRLAFVCHSFVVRSTKSPTMADCYVPPHPRSYIRPHHPPWLIVMYHLIRVFVCRLFVVRSSFVFRSFVVCSSFVCCLFVVLSSFVCRLFVHSFVRSSFVRPPHLPWLIVMHRPSM